MNDGFAALAEVLRRCKLKGVVELAKGSRSQLALRNTRAIEMLRGMLGAETNPAVRQAMEVEMLFLRARERYLKKNKLKKTLLNKAVYLASAKFAPEVAEYIKLRREVFINEAQNIEDLALLAEMNATVSGSASDKQTLAAALPEVGEKEYQFAGIELVFASAAALEQFQAGDYRAVLRTLKHSDSFDSALVCAIARVELFKQRKEQLASQPGKIARKTLARYLTQWHSLYQETLELFQRNFISTEYLDGVDQATQSSAVPSFVSVPLHPFTYDISSVYLQLKKTDLPQVAAMMGQMRITR